MKLSAGKYWSLRRLSGSDGLFRMIAVDQRPPIVGMVAKRRGVAVPTWEDVGAVKALLIEELRDCATALLLDPGYAYPYAVQHVDPRCGLLVTLEQFEFEERPRGRLTRLYPGWSVAKIKRLGADGVKLMLFYRPDADPEINRAQQDLVEDVGRQCRTHDIAFLLEPLVYPFAATDRGRDYHEDPDKRPELVIDTVREFAKPRYAVDIFKLESPVPAAAVPDPDAADDAARDTLRWFQSIDAALDRPWVMLSAGAGPEPFRRVLAFATRAGASGYLAGRALWWQAFQSYPDMAAFRAALRGSVRDYVAALGRELAAHGTPWWRRPAFGDGIELADAGPDFTSRYSEG